MEPKVKTIDTKYLIKVDKELSSTCLTLKEARALIKSLPVNGINNVQIVKQTLTEMVLDEYKPITQTVLVATQLDEDM